MKTLLLLSGLMAFTAGTLCAQVLRVPLTSTYPSLTTLSGQFTDAFALRGNSAALSSLKKVSAGVFSERRFLLQELSSHLAAVALPTASGNFGLMAAYQGGTAYGETELSLAYARWLGEKLAVGLRFIHFSQRAAGYGAAGALTFDGGLLVRLTDAFRIGLHAGNPVRAKLGRRGDERLPALYSLGMGYDVSPQLFIGADLQKVEDGPLAVNTGLQYVFAHRLVARAGINSANTVVTLGFGLQLKALQVHLSTSFHPQLGATPGLLLLYQKTE